MVRASGIDDDPPILMPLIRVLPRRPKAEELAAAVVVVDMEVATEVWEAHRHFRQDIQEMTAEETDVRHSHDNRPTISTMDLLLQSAGLRPGEKIGDTMIAGVVKEGRI